jgi:CD63 antigen
VRVSELRTILSNDHLSDVVPSVVIGIGMFIFIISFFGCCGAFQSNVCLLETYSICLLTLVLFQVIVASFVFLFIDDIQRDSVRSFSQLWRSQGSSQNSRLMIDMIEKNLECCGNKSYFDYAINMLPPSCCKKTVDNCTQPFANTIGCKQHLQESIKSSGQMIAYSCLVAAIFELIGSLLGFILSSYIRKVQAIKRCCFS